MLKKIKQFINWMNDKGVPVPLARKEGLPSVSFTLLILSATFVMVALLKIVVSFWEAVTWFTLCAVLYFNRTAKITKDGIEIACDDDNDKDKEDQT